MPYPIAHPAAAVPLRLLLGRHAVPSALAVGCLVPDLWYVLPFLEREQTHGIAGLAWFCLPAALALYVAFHLLLKQPLIALLPHAIGARAAAYATHGLPARPWGAVALCALAGAASHVLWDALTHGPGEFQRVLQHASTLAGSVFLALYLAAKLRAASPAPVAAQLPPGARALVLGIVLALSLLAGAAGALAHPPPARLDYAALRELVRASAVPALQALLSALAAYGLMWRLVSARRDVARHEHRQHQRGDAALDRVAAVGEHDR